MIGILAGTLRGRRRKGLGEAWDCRYHRYLDGASGRMMQLRPPLRHFIGGRSDEVTRNPGEGTEELLLRAS